MFGSSLPPVACWSADVLFVDVNFRETRRENSEKVATLGTIDTRRRQKGVCGV